MSFFVRHKNPGPLKPTANPYPSRIRQSWQKPGVVMLLLLLIVGGSLRFYPPFYITAHSILFEGTAWIQKVFIRPFHDAHAFFNQSHTFIHLKQDHARLMAENDALKWKLQALEPLVRENTILKQTLNIPYAEPYKHLTARVMATPYDGIHHAFLIEAGADEGLEKDQAVVAQAGILGRLEKVGRHVARVLLLNDMNSRIPVMTVTSQQKAILAGDGNFSPMLVYVSEPQTIQKGEQVVTSGLGGIFPAGLPVGIVSNTADGKIRVRPYVSPADLEWVHVLKTLFDPLREES